jgi:phosphoribosylanthranilate isomerase
LRVKICGITRLEDALAGAEEGASALGFIFVPSSPRYIPPAAAGEIIRMLPPFVTPVGVFVNETRETIASAIAASGVRCVQLHGDELAGETRGYPVPVIKAFRVGEDFDASVIATYELPAYVLDTRVEGLHGGTGTPFDWKRAAEASRYGRIIVGGGITPSNALAAWRTARPYGLDVSSGVESSPGVKDRGKIRALFEALRDA